MENKKEDKKLEKEEQEKPKKGKIFGDPVCMVEFD